jgi:rubrerythrin
MSLAAIPAVVFSAMPKIAFAQTSASAVDILNYALTLEFLEYYYYQRGKDTNIIKQHAVVFEQIRKHEEAHVVFLQEVIDSLGGTPVQLELKDFDYTVGGAFEPFKDYATFLTLAQAFEDTGVRAYKGQAANIRALGNNETVNTVLTAALSIHGVEARHASIVRRIREQKGWITGVDTSVPEAAQAVYGPGNPADKFPAEDNVTQGGVNLLDALGSIEGIDAAAISEAFDEPLDANTAAGTGTVYDIAGLFLAK